MTQPYGAAGRLSTSANPATAPLPKPDPRIQIVRDWANDLWGSPEHGDAIELLVRLDAIEEGEQS